MFTSLLGLCHYKCLGISTPEFKKNPQRFDVNWLCPECQNITKRRKNASTPIKNTQEQSLNYESDSDQSILGDTLKENSTDKGKPRKMSSDLKQLSDLLDEKLEKMQGIIVEKISKSIEEKFSESMKKLEEKLLLKYNNLHSTQTTLLSRVNEMEKKIQKLSEEKNQLENELRQISAKTVNSKPVEQKYYEKYEDNKKFVLYGLQETGYEEEWILIDQIEGIFRDLFNMDLSGCIESVTRIGRRGSNRRPIIIELISKRMTKHILQNTIYLKNTGFYISEYLNETERKMRRLMQDLMKNARKNGKHAIIKNNKLIINGKEHKIENNILENNDSNKDTYADNTFRGEHSI